MLVKNCLPSLAPFLGQPCLAFLFVLFLPLILNRMRLRCRLFLTRSVRGFPRLLAVRYCDCQSIIGLGAAF
eukprot:scaffold3158_cov389-Prasinococcus_capsulatus_cf.AAC.11